MGLLADVVFRRRLLLVVGLALHFLARPLALFGNRDFALLVSLAGGLILLAFLFANRRVHSTLYLFAAGQMLNLVVIAANRGMPISGSAARAAGSLKSAGEIVAQNAPFHVNLTSLTLLPLLADAVPFRLLALRSVVSCGDVLMFVAVSAFIVSMSSSSNLKGSTAPRRIEKLGG